MDELDQSDLCRTLNCNGKVNRNDLMFSGNNLFVSGEITQVLFPHGEYFFSHQEVKLFDRVLPAATAIFHLKHLTNCMAMKLKLLSRHEKYSHVLTSGNNTKNDFASIRMSICELMIYIRSYMNNIRWNYDALKIVNNEITEDFEMFFLTIKHFLARWQNISDSSLHFAASNLGNKCTQPEHHMFHMHLELRWFLIALIYSRNNSWNCIETRTEELEDIFAAIVYDFMSLAIKRFERFSLMDLIQSTPYNCTCVKELWLMIQISIDIFADRFDSKTFWDYVNLYLQELLDKNQLNNMKSYWHHSGSALPLECKNPELFSIWITYYLSLLYGYTEEGFHRDFKCRKIKDNYVLIEQALKTYISKGGKDGDRDEMDQELKIIIPFLRILITDFWEPRVQIVSLLWECFHRRLNQPFLLQTAGPWTLTIEKKTPEDILKLIKYRIDETLEQTKESSYGLFLRLIGTFLKKYYERNNHREWNQLKGRIYSKFSKGKVKELTESGLFNFFALFFTMAVTADTSNVCSVMLNLLPSLEDFKDENNKKYNLVWKSKLIVLLLYNEFGVNFNTVAASYIDTINLISCCKDEISRTMISNFVDVLSTILCSSEQTIIREEYLFIDGWIDRYLLECSKAKSRKLINALVVTLERCALHASNNSKNAIKLIEALWCHAAGRVRQLIFDSAVPGDYYKDLSSLAVAFTVEALRDPILAKRQKHSAASLFQHFASSVIIKDIRITRFYLKQILQKPEAVQILKKDVRNFDQILIQAYVKCCFLTSDEDKDEIQILQDYVSDVNDIKEILNNDWYQFRTSHESIFVFLTSFMKKRNSFTNEIEKTRFDNKCRPYFQNIEKWILLPIIDELKESDTAFWIYRCSGTLILYCSPILYIKHQPNNILRLLINKLLLPAEPTQSCIKNLGKKIFSMVLLGIENLSFKADITLQALIRDLFDQYIPSLVTDVSSSNNFKVSDTLLKLFEDANSDFLRLIFEMLMTNFFNISSDNLMHKHSYLVMLLLKKLITGGKIYSNHVLNHIITICASYIFGCYMKVHDHHPHKKYTMEFISDIVKNPYYKDDVFLMKDKFQHSIFVVVQKYLTVNPQYTFEFLRTVASVNTCLTEHLTPFIENTIVNYEKMKQPIAASLRYSWNEFKIFVNNIKTKL